MAQDRAVAKGGAIISLQQVGGGTTLNPVIPFIAKDNVQASTGTDEIITKTRERLGITFTTKDGITAIATEQQVKGSTGIKDHVMAITGLDVVVAEGVAENVVAGTTEEKVVARSTLQGVVAFIAMNGVITFPRGQAIGTGCSPHHHMLDTAIGNGPVNTTLEQGGLAVGRLDIIQDGPGHAQTGSLKPVRGGGKRISRQMARRGVAHDDFRKRLLLELHEHIQTGRAGEVIEAVMVLQPLHLGAEHVREG